MAVALVNSMTGEKVTTHLPIDEIIVGNRHRNAFGDIAELAASIKTVGLLNPITVTDGNRLVAGHRRLEACRSLGVAEVPVRIVRSIDSAVKVLIAERDENTCRKDMTPAELKSLTDALLELERPAAKVRMLNGGDPGISRSQGPEGGKAAARAAEAAGWSRGSYERTKRVMEAAKDETLPADVRTTAAVLVDGLTDGTVTPNEADRRLKEAKADPDVVNPKSRAGIEMKVAKAKEMAAAGFTSRQIGEAIGIGQMSEFRQRHGIEVPADAIVGKPQRIDSNRIVSETVSALEGLAMGVDLIDMEDLNRDDLAEWATSLNNSLRSLNRLSKQLKEMTL